jgi:hypothetical protein
MVHYGLPFCSGRNLLKYFRDGVLQLTHTTGVWQTKSLMEINAL